MVLFRRQAGPDDALAVALRHINPGLWISVPFRRAAARVVASRGAVILPGLGNPVTLFRRITRRSGNGFLRSRNGGSRESGDQRRCNQNTLVHVSSFFYRLYLWAEHKAPEATSLPRPITSKFARINRDHQYSSSCILHSPFFTGSRFCFLAECITGASSSLGQNLLKSCIQPSAHRKWHLEGLYVENNLQCLLCGIKNNAAPPTPRDMVFESPPKFGRTLFVYIIRQISQHFLA